jgi:hypothetical protein
MPRLRKDKAGRTGADEMTFDEWWDTLDTREKARAVKEDVREAYDVGFADGVRSEREACTEVCDLIDQRQDVETYTAQDCATAIRARSTPAA